MAKKKGALESRRLRFTRSLLKQHCVSIVNVGGRQGLVHWKNLKSIAAGRLLAEGICDLPHEWTIYLAVLCRSQTGEQYIKSEEVAPQGQYRAEHLTEVIRHYHDELTATCNPAHIVQRAWIALPYRVTVEEEQAARVFDAVGAWEQESLD